MSSEKTKVPFDRVCDFVIEMGEAAHKYGSSSPRLEIFLSSVMSSFGYSGSVLSTPGEMLFALQETSDKPQRFHMLSALQSGLDLDKLSRIGELVEDVVKEHISLDDAFVLLKEIRKAPPPWNMIANTLSYSIVGVGFAGVLLGSWWDIVVSVPLSLLVYLMVVLSARIGTRGTDWLPLISAFVVGMLAGFAKIFIPELNVVLVGIASIAVLLPGYTISMGVMDLVGGHVLSGNMNIVNGMVYMLKQVAGMWIGVELVMLLADLTTPIAAAPDIIWQWLFVPVLAIGLCLCFQTSKRDFIWAFLACIIAYVGSLYGGTIFGGNVGNLLGTTLLVIYSNNWSRKSGRPTSIVLVPGIVMLISGSMGFRGLASIVAGQIQQGENQIQHMIFVALTIGAGLVVGNTISKQKISL